MGNEISGIGIETFGNGVEALTGFQMLTSCLTGIRARGGVSTDNGASSKPFVIAITMIEAMIPFAI